MKIHVFYTWALVNCLHPVLFIAIGLIFNSSYFLLDDDIGMAIVGFILFFFASLPCLFICWFAMRQILLYSASVMDKFCMWLICALLVVVMHIGLIMLITKNPNPEIFLMFSPLLASVFSAIVIRRKQFIILAADYKSDAEQNKITME